MPALASPPQRIASLDQFRGYTVAGMCLVNFLGGFDACPTILKHRHDYCSYADTIMPHFLFAVGFAFRLTFERNVQKSGAAAAYRRVVRRLLGLVLISLVLYSPPHVAETWSQFRELGWSALARPLKREWFQTLMQIAVTSLWILPVIRARAAVRVLFAVASAVVHAALSQAFNFEWVNNDPRGIDGGPLGFLTWTIPAVAGTLVCDALTAASPRLGRCILSGIALAGLGWAISCGTRLYDRSPGDSDAILSPHPVIPVDVQLEGRSVTSLLAEPPFVPPPDPPERAWNYWMMSQRSGTISYLVFSAGFSVIVFALFYLACDRAGWGLGLFRTLGTNALAAYILHDLVDGAVSPFVPRDAPGWYVAGAFTVYLGVVWVLVRGLERSGVRLRL